MTFKRISILVFLRSFAALFLFTFNACASDDLTIIQDSSKQVFSDDDLSQKLHLDRLEVEDPVYQKHKRYTGYWLSDILDLAGIHPDKSKVLVFRALDGYLARISVADMINSKARAFVAIADLDKEEGWEKILQGKEWISPGPYYLVWQIPPGAPSGIKLPWPYQMVEIRIRDVNEAQEKLFPDEGVKSESVVRGFKVFSQNCIACHSLNLEGGVLGPELNVPRNILEYRDRKALREFIGDPSSFRARSKMPSFDKILSGQSLDDVLDYLDWMGKHKAQ